MDSTHVGAAAVRIMEINVFTGSWSLNPKGNKHLQGKKKYKKTRYKNQFKLSDLIYIEQVLIIYFKNNLSFILFYNIEILYMIYGRLHSAVLF